MFSVGEYIGSKGEIDGYCQKVQYENGGSEFMMGGYDVPLRGAIKNGVIDGGGYGNLGSVVGEQLGMRYNDYEDGQRVHRSLNYINSHDTFRPIVDEKGNFLHMRRLSTPEHLTWKSFKQGMLVCHQAFLAKRELALKHPYNLQYRFSADFDWCIRIMKEAKCLHNTRLTLVNYLNEGMTTRNHKASLKERFRIMAKHYGWTSTILHHCWFVIRLFYKP
jgi:hypothetical protein